MFPAGSECLWFSDHSTGFRPSSVYFKRDLTSEALGSAGTFVQRTQSHVSQVNHGNSVFEVRRVASICF